MHTQKCRTVVVRRSGRLRLRDIDCRGRARPHHASLPRNLVLLVLVQIIFRDRVPVLVEGSLRMITKQSSRP